MSLQTLKQPRAWLVPTALLLLLTLACVLVARTAFARITANTIDPVARLSEHGRGLLVSGPLVGDTAGEKVLLRVTVTQRTTGAVAEGLTEFAASGNSLTNQWHVRAATQGQAAFAPGPATAVGVAITTVKGQVTDAHQWLVNITIVE